MEGVRTVGEGGAWDVGFTGAAGAREEVDVVVVGGREEDVVVEVERGGVEVVVVDVDIDVEVGVGVFVVVVVEVVDGEEAVTVG